MFSRSSFRMAAACLLAWLLVLPAQVRAEGLLVFAAASLKTALDKVAEGWRAETGKVVTISYAGSSSLARQIEQGAPADIFISASVEWMDYLEAGELIRNGSRRDLLGNRLVLIAHDRVGADLDLSSNTGLAMLLGDGRLAMALVDSVPAGVYGKQALSSLGLWESIRDKVAQTDNVRAALALVSSGEAPCGIVYASDALADPGVRVVAVFPEASHAPIIYPGAIVAGSTASDAEAFLSYLSGPSAGEVFRGQGFAPLSGPGNG